MRRLLAALAGVLASMGAAVHASPTLPTSDRLLVGVGDRLTMHAGGRSVFLPDEARRLGVGTDLFQIWLPRGWQDSWIEPSTLSRLLQSGTTPVVAHWFFGDAISRERVQAEVHEWHRSLGRMGRRIAVEGPVLVLLEPEFNNEPPPGETAVTAWPGFAAELREAARIVRREAPNALVGVCAGDNSPTRNLEAILAPVAADLDFLAFQEMRADTRREGPDALGVGAAAVDYARYLKRAFGRPILLGYVAVSSHGGWEGRQAEALRGLVQQRTALRAAGVFGVVYFQLRDDPEHLGWFGPAERHFGLTTSTGEPKPALEAFRALGR